ncbi:MAG TPA: hypothetical protein VFG14_14620 [Chthoniobacteraceae bacterium]|jgi:hypothetical protein|nr:hypothetical protein [Chthoniobacteraceae bacterium]
MSNPTERRLTKQECERAAQLLAGMVERAEEKAVEAVSSTQIQNAPEERTSSAGEKADGGERFGEIANSNHRPRVILGGQDDRREREAEGGTSTLASAGGGQRIGLVREG